MARSTIIFDLDGTLVDTAPDLIDTLDLIFGREGMPPVDYDQARALIGFGAWHMIERGLALSAKSVPASEIERMFADFLDHYGGHLADRSRPFPGLEAALDLLAARGCRFAVCTNKLERHSVQLLEALGLAGRFAAICGQDTFGVRKPDARAVLGTLRKAGGNVSRAIMVGDSQTDITAAKSACIPVVAVDFGYTEIPVRELAPDKVISHFDDLPEAVAALLGPATERPSHREDEEQAWGVGGM
jgi:phosphoglycolate phosphatase